MKTLYQHIETDIRSLVEKGFVENARSLNEALGNGKIFAELGTPMYFNGNPEATTVFAMLNPGSGGDKFNLNFEKGEDIRSIVDKHIDAHIRYGENDKERHDHFDLKQASFLSGFPNSGIDIPDFSNNADKDIKLKAKENVLMQKLQLELVPYTSKSFLKIFDNLEMALQNIDPFLPHMNRLLDTIIEKKRTYVLFGSQQYAHIFYAMKLKGYADIEVGTPAVFTIDGLKNKVNFNTVVIQHKGERIEAGIPYSFPRKDLPNAHMQMKKYGEACYQEMKKRFH
jgi:hypothetical protein